MGSDPVPADVAREVAEFVWARTRDPLLAQTSAEEIDRRWDEMGLVRQYQVALERGREMTADNLAYTLLAAAARYAEHEDYQERWRSWTPYGDLRPGGLTDGPLH